MAAVAKGQCVCNELLEVCLHGMARASVIGVRLGREELRDALISAVRVAEQMKPEVLPFDLAWRTELDHELFHDLSADDLLKYAGHALGVADVVVFRIRWIDRQMRELTQEFGCPFAATKERSTGTLPGQLP